MLRRVTIENLRGIRQMDVRLGETVVLVGENACGKSTFLDALELVLGIDQPPGSVAFSERDFAAGGVGPDAGAPIRLLLEFAEAYKAAWDAEFRNVAKRAITMEHGEAGLRLEILAALTAGGEVVVHCHALNAAGGRMEGANGAELLAILRRRFPYIAAGRLPEETSVKSMAPEFAEAAQVCLREFNELSRSEFLRCQQLSDEILDDLRQGLIGRGQGDVAKELAIGGGAQSLAPLLLFGSLMRRHEGRLERGALPLLGLPEIETHLHPILFGAMWKIVEALPVQRLITTYSGDFLSLVGLTDIRRMERRNSDVYVYGLGDRDLTDDERRRVSYHIRARRGSALFARAWLLVEGETEAWLMPELARVMGYDLMSEGVSLIEFAQAGLGALLRAANGWGIEWHLLTDGDRAGDGYMQAARFHLNGRSESECLTQIPDTDIERHLWREGFQDVYRRAAGRAGRLASGGKNEADAARVISKAIEKSAKPWLALQVADELWRNHGTNTPKLLAQCVQAVVRLARSQDSFTPEAA